MFGQIGAVGEFTLRLNLLMEPANDNFAQSQPLFGANIVMSGSTFLATTEPQEPSHGNGGQGNSVWFIWSPPADGSVTLSLNSGFSPLIDVYTGSDLNSLVQVGGGNLSVLNFDVRAGTIYHIAVDVSRDTSPGPFTLALAETTRLVRPPNDDFANRTPITGTNLLIIESNTNATYEYGEPGPGSKSSFARFFGITKARSKPPEQARSMKSFQ